VRLEGWRIDGFGVLKDLRRDDLGRGVTVLLGENEAGKSTLLGFVRAMLFGFPDGRTKERQYPPLRGGRHGGRLLLRDRYDALWTVERYADKRREVVVTGPDGEPGDEADLRGLLGGADAGLFKSVFAFSLEELQDFDSLSGAGVRDRIFSAGISGAGRSAREVVARLDRRAKELLKAGRGQAEINDLVRELERVEAEERAAAAVADRHGELLGRERASEEAAGRLATEAAGVRERRSHLDALIAVRPDWDELRQLQLELGELPSVTDDSVPQRVAGLVQELERQRTREERLPGLESTQAQERGALEGALGRLGEGWDVERVRDFTVTVALTDAVQTWVERLDEAERARDEAQRTLDGARAEAGRLEAELKRRSDALTPREPLSTAEVERREAGLRSVRENTNQLRLLRLQAEQAAGRGGSRLGRLWLLAVLAGGAAAGGLAALLLDGGQLGIGLFIAAALLLVAYVVLAFGTGGRGGRAEPGDGATVVEELAARVDEEAASLGVTAAGGELPAGALDAVEAELKSQGRARASWDDAQRGLGEATRQLADARRLVAETTGRAEETSRTLAEVSAGWTTWLGERGLRGLSPGGALQLFDEAADAHAADARLREAHDAAEAIRRGAEAWRDEAAAALTDCGRSVEGLSDEALRSAVERLAADLERRRAVLERIGALDRQLTVRLGLDSPVCGVSPADVVPGQTVVGAEAGEDGAAPAAAVLEELADGDPAAWSAESAALGEQFERLQGERDEALQEAAAARTERLVVERSADVPRLQEERESLRARLLELAHEYRVVVTARTLISATLTRYVRERQPAVLAGGSKAFAAMTHGRYQRIDLDEESSDLESVVVVDRDGGRLTPEQLSTGTQQQLYLALRLALVDEFSRRTEPLPLIMDDCLVNFDPERRAAVAELLAARFADGQCLLFTCHPETAELLAGQAAGPARVIEMAPAC